MNDGFDLISFFGSGKSVTTTAAATALFSIIQDNDWITIDSWSEVGVLFGIAVTLVNFIIGLYDKFWRRKKSHP